MKKFDPQDPKWTAYVLNELDRRAAEAVEQEMKEHPEARELVESIRATVGLIETALAAEPEVMLDDAQMKQVEQAAEKSARGRLIRFPFRIPIGMTAAAALVISVLSFERLQNIIIVFFGYQLLFVASLIAWITGSDGGWSQWSSAGAKGAAERARMLYSANAPPPAIISPSLDDFGELRPNTFQRVTDHPLSTFSIDVDTASYSVVRKFLNEGRLPPADAVRIEELVNYFTYDYPAPKDQTPFAAHMEVAPAPWQTKHYLVRVALKGREIPSADRPPMNLTYLLDVSGSMNGPNRLPLVKRALQALVNQLDERDRLAIVVYAGAAGLVLPPTSGAQPKEILGALERLEAGGSTAGGEGIQQAYQVARDMFQSNAVNRVILCTDGDFNVGLTQRGDLERLIEQEATSGVFLTVLGFGMGNYKDSTLELLSNKGNGNYGYIDDFSEARKMLVDQMFSTLITIAKDVKIQVEFNPAHVEAYKLIGYENRMLKKEDFNNDKVDAGDIGAGHTVTAFYEIIPAGQAVPDVPAVDALKYQPVAAPSAPKSVEGAGEILTLKLRYKEPDGVTSSKLEFALDAGAIERMDPSIDFRFASAVAGFGMLLRGGGEDGGFAMKDVLGIAETSAGQDSLGYRAEFIRLVRNAMALQPAR